MNSVRRIFFFVAVLAGLGFCARAHDAHEAPKAAPRFALSFYHFNIQSVLDDGNAKNRIVKQAFEPLLDLYLKHPQWGCDIELQAMFLEFLEVYHPAVLEKLRKLVGRGQVELVSFGWSGTLGLAYPLHDQEWSDRMAADVFKRLKLARAPIVFGAEGQFGAGMLYSMKDSGFFIALAPATTLQYFHNGQALSPMYRAWKGVVLPAGARFKRDDFSVDWNYFNNGEAALTKGASPAEASFAFSAEAAAKHERKLADYAAAGWIVCRISDYVKFARTGKFAPPELPALPDSAWSLKAADSFFLWMGWYATPVERDVEILSAAYGARNELTLAETLITYAKAQQVDTGAEESLLRDAWRAVLITEASGATGPDTTSAEAEMAYGLAARARDTGVNIIRSLKGKLNLPAVEIDSYTGEVKGASSAAEEVYPAARCPVTPDIYGADDGYSVACRRVSDVETEMVVTAAPSRWGLSLLSVAFPLLGDRLQFSPGMMETYFADFAFEDFTNDHFVLPLSNGLVGLGDNKTFVITHNDVSHLSVNVDPGHKTISFQIKNAPTKVFTLKFSVVVTDPATALQTANRINTFPHGLR